MKLYLVKAFSNNRLMAKEVMADDILQAAYNCGFNTWEILEIVAIPSNQ